MAGNLNCKMYYQGLGWNTSQTPNQGDSGEGKDVATLDGNYDATDPSPKSKKSKRGTGTPNKRWNKEESDFVVDFLANKVDKTQKIHKTFKKPALVAAIGAVNEKFNQNFTLDNLENHLRNLKSKWRDIIACRKLSGASWDEEKKMIILDKATYDISVADHENRKNYINVPIPNYDNLLAVCGETFATGAFKKPIYAKFGHNEDDFTDLDDNNEVDGSSPKLEDASAYLKPPQIVSSKSSKKQKQAAYQKSKLELQQEMVKELVSGLGVIAKAIEASAPEDWRKALSKVVMEQKGFDDDDLDEVFDHLASDEHKALNFLAKPQARQTKLVGDLISKMKANPGYHLDV